MPASRRARETHARRARDARDATQHSPPVRDVVGVVVVGGVAVWPAARNEHPGVDRPSRGGTRAPITTRGMGQ